MTIVKGPSYLRWASSSSALLEYTTWPRSPPIVPVFHLVMFYNWLQNLQDRINLIYIFEIHLQYIELRKIHCPHYKLKILYYLNWMLFYSKGNILHSLFLLLHYSIFVILNLNYFIEKYYFQFDVNSWLLDIFTIWKTLYHYN